MFLDVELGMWNIKVVLWKLCKFVWMGVSEEFDVVIIIGEIVKKGGMLDIYMML